MLRRAIGVVRLPSVGWWFRYDGCDLSLYNTFGPQCHSGCGGEVVGRVVQLWVVRVVPSVMYADTNVVTERRGAFELVLDVLHKSLLLE